MANVTGPTRNLPGSSRPSPQDTACDDCGVPAVVRLTGEVDSYGSEESDHCQACYDKVRKAIAETDTSGCCQWCKKHADHLFAHRDFDEGSTGPVYSVCSACVRRQNEAVQEELDYHRRNSVSGSNQDDEEEETFFRKEGGSFRIPLQQSGIPPVSTKIDSGVKLADADKMLTPKWPFPT